jgi:hypothetical protein
VEFFGFFLKSDRAKENGAPAGVENHCDAPAGRQPVWKTVKIASQC